MGGSYSKVSSVTAPGEDQSRNFLPSSTTKLRYYSSLLPPLPSAAAAAAGVVVIPRTQCDAGISSPPAPPPPLPPPQGDTPSPPPTPETIVNDDAISQATKKVSAYSSPGPYDMAAMDGKRIVSLDTYEGFRCDINKQASPFMVVVHSFLLGANLPDGRRSTYNFMCQVADETSLLLCQIDPARQSVNGRVHKALLGGIGMGKVQIGITPDGQGDQILAELDLSGRTFTGNLKYGSMGGGLVYGCNYLQAITPRLVMGGEGMYIAANGSVVSNYTLKYTLPAKTGDEDTALQELTSKSVANPRQPPGAPAPETTGSSTMCVNWNASQQMLSMNYKRVVTPNRVTLGAELSCNPFTLESQVLLGAEFKLQRSRVALCMDGDLRMQTIVEAKLGMTPGSPTLQLSADVDHLKEEMKFGYGLTIDG